MYKNLDPFSAGKGAGGDSVNSSSKETKQSRSYILEMNNIQMWPARSTTTKAPTPQLDERGRLHRNIYMCDTITVPVAR